MHTILWPALFNLALLDLAMIISWTAYHQYQPVLIKQFGFDTLIYPLSILQTVILLIIPPIAGWFADREKNKHGHCTSIIGLGINIVSMIFMAAAFTIFIEPTGLLRWILPILIILWLIAMNIFHSPAFAMLESLASPSHLVFASAILIMVNHISYGIEDLILLLTDFLGIPLTFVVGGILIFISGTLLKINLKPINTATKTTFQNSRFLLVFIIGIIVGIGLYYINKNDGFFMIISAIIALPIAIFIRKLGLILSFWLSSLLFFLLLFLIKFPIVMLINTILLTFMAVAAFPLVFQSATKNHKILAIGLFISGMQLPASIFIILNL